MPPIRPVTTTLRLVMLATLLPLGACVPDAAVRGDHGAASHAALPRLQRGDALDVRFRSDTTDLALRDDEARRIAARIAQAFGPAGAPPRADAARYGVEIAVVNYSTGYDYIRAMTPYNGQVHVDARVRVLALADGRELGSLNVSQSFEPREVTNAASRIGDIEEPLVQSVVDALSGAAPGPR